MTIDPRTLTPRPVPPEGNCYNCGYDLHGLPPGSGCPECGLGREPPRKRRRPRNRDDQLATAPLDWLRFFALGAFSLVAAGGCWILAMLAGAMGAYGLRHLFILLAAFSWCAGVLLVTRPRPRHGAKGLRREWTPLRLAARASVPAVPLAGAMHAAGVLPPEAAALLLPIGLASAAFTAVYLARLADWAGDDGRARSLRGWVVLMPLAIGIAALLVWSTGSATGSADIVATVLVVSGLFLVPFVWCAWFAWSLVRIASLAAWALKGKRLAEARLQRLARGAGHEARHCEYCGYDLFGLPWPTRCPECGEAEVPERPPRFNDAPKHDETPIPLAEDSREAREAN